MKAHPIDPLSFVLGAFFLVTGAIFASGGDASKLNAAWFWPVVLGLTGVGLMLLTARSFRSRDEAVSSVESTPVESAPAGPDPSLSEEER
jgi:hypothetical protein